MVLSLQPFCETPQSFGHIYKIIHVVWDRKNSKTVKTKEVGNDCL